MVAGELTQGTFMVKFCLCWLRGQSSHNQIAGWTKWNICLSRNQTLLNLIARKG
uniref:Uncharacterized protein n=1 Tax=Helianthus annuus TaxID=4232 RepID=A0A251SNH2_HELAN